jgi:plasmid stabilization system protein ParE
MAEKIIWTHQALTDYEEIKKYLLSSFGDLAVSEFLFSLNKKLDYSS